MDKAEYVARAPYWLIAREESGGTYVLTFDFAGAIGGKEILPVFSFREEAEVLLPGKPGSGWRVRESSKRELLSMLFGSYAAVKYVTLDPWPGPGMEELVDLVGVGREVFTDHLMGRGRSWFYARRNEENRNKKRRQRGGGALVEERASRRVYRAPLAGKEKRLSERSRRQSEVRAPDSTAPERRVQDLERLAREGHQRHLLQPAGDEKPQVAYLGRWVVSHRQSLGACGGFLQGNH